MKMPLTHYNLSSKAYRSTVFTGFSRFQKEEEFVDLTLAADGCFCKVHRSLIALASPYLRDILRNLQGNAPVIYLNKIRKEILEYILEYIYQGDVNVPVQLLEEFIEVSKSLHIAGIADLEPPKVSPEPLKSTTKKAKKRKLERVPNIEVCNPTDCTNLTQLSEHANTFNVFNDDNDDHCMKDQYKPSNTFELRSHNNKHDRESNKLVIVKNSNKDLITFHSRNEQHNPSLQIENVFCHHQSSEDSQPLIDELPSETQPELLIDQLFNAQNYKIIVKPTKDQTEAHAENIPVIEIQPCLSQHDNNGLTNKLAMQANISSDNNIESCLPVFNILMNDNMKNLATDYVTHSSEVSQPLIQTVAVPDKNEEGSSKPVININRNDIIKQAETENDTPSLFQVRQPLIEIGSIPDQDYEEKSKPVIKILKNDVIKRVEADCETSAFQGQPSIQASINLGHNNVEESVPAIKILSNEEGLKTDVGELSFKATLNDMKNMAQYSITERGALQLILNRFIYCCHGTSTKKQRWRCIDYRRGACPAIVDTGADGAIVYRKGIHGHKFHDKKIFQKHKRGLIFSTIALAVIAKDSKQKEGSKTVSLDESDDVDVVYLGIPTYLNK